MNQVSLPENTTLPSLIDRAAGALTAAKTSAEVLEARDLARVAYDAAKSAGRMARAKKAHEEVIAAVYRAQADALLIEARAKMRLADEYDEAQGRGEVAGLGANQHRDEGVADSNTLGLRRDEIHEARGLRDAEKADPGKAERALNDMVDRGEEPTKAKLRREVKPEDAPEPPKEKEPKHILKLRREFRALTPDAQEDDWISLRQHCAELKGQVRDWKSKFNKIKAEMADLTADDKAEVIRRQAEKIKHYEREMYQANAKFDAEKRKNYALNKRIKELEQMGVAY